MDAQPHSPLCLPLHQGQTSPSKLTEMASRAWSTHPAMALAHEGNKGVGCIQSAWRFLCTNPSQIFSHSERRETNVCSRDPAAAYTEAAGEGQSSARDDGHWTWTVQMPAGGQRNGKHSRARGLLPSGILLRCEFRVKPAANLLLTAAGGPDPARLHTATDAV